MVQLMTFMASDKHFMNRLMAKFLPKYCIFGAGFFSSFGAVFAPAVWYTGDCEHLAFSHLRLNRR